MVHSMCVGPDDRQQCYRSPPADESAGCLTHFAESAGGRTCVLPARVPCPSRRRGGPGVGFTRRNAGCLLRKGTGSAPDADSAERNPALRRACIAFQRALGTTALRPSSTSRRFEACAVPDGPGAFHNGSTAPASSSPQLGSSKGEQKSQGPSFASSCGGPFPRAQISFDT